MQEAEQEAFVQLHGKEKKKNEKRETIKPSTFWERSGVPGAEITWPGDVGANSWRWEMNDMP